MDKWRKGDIRFTIPLVNFNDSRTHLRDQRNEVTTTAKVNGGDAGGVVVVTDVDEQIVDAESDVEHVAVDVEGAGSDERHCKNDVEEMKDDAEEGMKLAEQRKTVKPS